MDIKEIVVDKMHPARMKWLHEELDKNRLSHQEYQKECAYWLLEDGPWNDLKTIETPPKPQAYEEWERMSKDVKDKCEKSYFDDNPSINWFADKCLTIYHQNHSIMSNLIYLKGFLLIDDNSAHTKYYYKIKEFLNMLLKNNYFYKMIDNPDKFRVDIIDIIEKRPEPTEEEKKKDLP